MAIASEVYQRKLAKWQGRKARAERAALRRKLRLAAAGSTRARKSLSLKATAAVKMAKGIGPKERMCGGCGACQNCRNLDRRAKAKADAAGFYWDSEESSAFDEHLAEATTAAIGQASRGRAAQRIGF